MSESIRKLLHRQSSFLAYWRFLERGRSKDGHRLRTVLLYAAPAAGLVGMSFLSGMKFQWLHRDAVLCREVPIGSKEIFGERENYFKLAFRKQSDDQQIPDEPLLDADLNWPLTEGRFHRMAVSQVNANAELEDRALLQAIQTPSNGELTLAAVADGHGGWQVAEYVQRKLAAYVDREINSLSVSTGGALTDSDFAVAMKAAFTRLDEDLMQKIKGTCDLGLSRSAKVGACCVATLITPSSVIVANAGDCRAILVDGSSVIELSEPHSANEPTERKRLQEEHPGESDIVVCKKSLSVERNPQRWIDYPIKWMGWLGHEVTQSACYVKGRLQPTRSFGDFYLKKKEFAFDYESDRPFVKGPSSFPYITAEPDVKVFPVRKGQVVLLASDGVWDFLKPEEVGEITTKNIMVSPEAATSSVIQAVLRRAAEVAGIGFSDMALMAPKRKRDVFDDTTVCIVKIE